MLTTINCLIYGYVRIIYTQLHYKLDDIFLIRPNNLKSIPSGLKSVLLNVCQATLHIILLNESIKLNIEILIICK